MTSYFSLHKKHFSLQEFIENALQEDVGDGDHSALATIPASKKGKFRLLVKEDGIIAGVAFAKMVFEYVDSNLEIETFIEDGTPVKKGDILVYRTAGGGGWKDPFDRPSEKVFKDVRNGLVSIEKARSDYGVVLDAKTLAIDEAATETLRADLRAKRGEFPLFSIGEVPEAIGVVATWGKSAATAA